MRVESAIYGEVNNGHALRAASGDHAFAKTISGRLDLPSNPPSGVSWSPATSGFPVHDRYVVARTFLDASASRSGFVVSHALFVRLDDMQHFASLDRLFACLATGPAAIPEPAGFDVEKGPSPETVPELRDAAARLIESPAKAVVKLDGDGFEALVAAIWHMLWSDMRRDFAFRLSFGPTDLIEAPAPALVSTPLSLAARWHGHPIIGKGAAKPLPKAAEILLGDVSADGYKGFADEIGAGRTSLSRLPLLVRAHDMLSPDASFEEIVGGLRIVDHLSRDSRSGEAAKSALLTRLADAMPGASAEQMMGLRNLALPGFASLKRVWSAAETWLGTYSLSKPGAIEALTELIGGLGDPTSAIEPWRAALWRGAEALTAHAPDEFAKALWIWIGTRPALVNTLFAIAPIEKAMENRLVAALPTEIARDTAALRVLLVKRSWLRLHGAVVALTLPAEAAADAQLAVDTKPDHDAGINAALSHATPQQRVGIAIDRDDPRLDALASAAAARAPNLLRSCNFHRIGTQRIWAGALAKSDASWQAPADPATTRDALLISALDGDDHFAPLVNALSRTPLADLSDFSRRAEIWERFDPSKGYVRATGEAWIRRACTGEAYARDPILTRAILESSALDRALDGSMADPGATLNLIASLTELPEQRAIGWFDRLGGPASRLTQQQAERLGRIILERHWAALLVRVRDRVFSVPELRAVLRVCVSMLSLLSRWSLGLSTITVDEKWESFAKVAADLYPSGPDHDGLWERCGGRNSQLPRHVTGENAWRAALALVRRGTDVRPGTLVKEMRNDFSSNPDLRFIASDSTFAGGGSHRKSD